MALSCSAKSWFTREIVAVVVSPGSRSPIHRPSRPGFADAGVASCARSVTHLRDALPRVLVGSLSPAAKAASWRACSQTDHLKDKGPEDPGPCCRRSQCFRLRLQEPDSKWKP